MTLRTRLFLLIGGLVAALGIAQALWVRALAADLSLEVGNVATSVGRSVAGVFWARLPCPEGARCEELPLPKSGDPAGSEEVRWQVKVDVEAHRGGPAPIDPPIPAASPAGAPEDGDPLPADRERLRRIVLLHGGPDGGPLGADPATLPGGGRVADHLVRLLRDGEEPVLSFVGPNQVWHRVPIPAEGLFGRLETFSTRAVLGSLAILLAGIALAALVAHRVAAPLARLATAAREVGEGTLGAHVDHLEPAAGEVGVAIAAFNRMSDRLVELDAHNRRLAADRHLGEIGEVARGLAHSLRNPLNALGLSLEELAGASDSSRASELAAAARRQIGRADRALRSFLALASEGGGAATQVELGDLAADVALEVLHDGPGVSVEVEAAPGLAPIRAVEPELRAVLQALVVNAAEASPPGEKVEVAIVPWADGCRIEVRDRGCGLPEGVRARLFTPHVSTKESGAGMGLFLAHRVATSRYAGALELADRAGGGTVATLRLRPRDEAERKHG